MAGLSLWRILAVASTVSAAFTGNLNYFSPSNHHASLGVSIGKVAKRTFASSFWDPAQLNFTHGVASGDPRDDGVILWTRAAPSADNDRSNITVSGYVPLFDHSTEPYVSQSDSPVCVEWKISLSRCFTNVVDSGTAFTSSDVDYTVKVEARKLKPFTTYYYQFAICSSNNTSPIGRTKTIPSKEQEITSQIKIAVYSCSNFPFGFFNGYGNVVRKDSVDYIVHLGDYIYEYANGVYGWGNSLDRVPQPDKEIVSLYDYRKRLATYRTDLDLIASHQQFPWIPVWDDHEFANNMYRDGFSAMNNTEDSFIKDGGVAVDQRKMNAVRAYFEWMPIRQVDMDDNLRIWRDFQFGDLFDLIMLDTRAYDRSVTDLAWNTDYISDISNDASRTLMGPRQETWFYRKLRESSERGATWRLIGNQLIFSRMNMSRHRGEENPLNVDLWDGYQANRNRTFSTLYENNIDNNVFLAGDSHAAWVSDLVWLGEHDYDPVSGAGAVGVEFAGTAVCSPGIVGENVTIADAVVESEWITAANRELQWQEYYFRGYYELEITHESVKAAFFGIPTSKIRQGHEIPLANFTVLSGENRLHRSDGSPAVGTVESGSLKGGNMVQTNLTHDTNTGEWFVYQW